MYQDKTLVCRDCGGEFVFSAGEQEFFASLGAAKRAGPLPEGAGRRVAPVVVWAAGRVRAAVAR